MEIELLKFLSDNFGIIGTIAVLTISGTFYTILILIRTLRASLNQNNANIRVDDELEKQRMAVTERLIVMTGELINTNGLQNQYTGEQTKTLVNINKVLETYSDKASEQLQISKEMLSIQRQQAEALNNLPAMLKQTEEKLLQSQTDTSHSLQKLLKELSAKLFTTAQDMNVAAEKINDSQDLKGAYDKLVEEGKLPSN